MDNKGSSPNNSLLSSKLRHRNTEVNMYLPCQKCKDKWHIYITPKDVDKQQRYILLPLVCRNVKLAAVFNALID